MELFTNFEQFIDPFLAGHGLAVYATIFIIIFLETGLVVTPFLPGDSLLFAAGALAARGDLEIMTLFFILLIAAISGDTLNYWIGHFIGVKLIKQENHLQRAQNFYQKHGAKAIVLARFAPLLRTFVPFIAGISHMPYRLFMRYNILGGFIWVVLFAGGGYLFGNIPQVKENLNLVVAGIVLFSVLLLFFEYAVFKKKIRVVWTSWLWPPKRNRHPPHPQNAPACLLFRKQDRSSVPCQKHAGHK